MDGSRRSSPRPRAGPYFAVFAVLVTTIALVGLTIYSTQRRQLETELREQLAQIATLKAGQVANWRTRQRDDVQVIVASAQLMPAVRRHLAGAIDRESDQRLIEWLEEIRLHFKYATAMLLGSDGTIKLSAGEPLATPERYRELAAEARRAEDVLLKDVPAGNGVNRAHFILGAPLRATDGAMAGMMLFSIDPTASLLSQILTWPLASATGDVVLIRRDDSSALYLSAPRTSPGEVMALRDAHDVATSPAAQAINGSSAIDATDRAGAAVVGAAASIENSPWVLLATMAANEAYAPARQLAQRLLPIGAVLALMSAGVLALIWRYQISTFERQRALADQELRALLGHYEFLARFGNDAIVLLGSDGSIVEVNDRVVEWFGYSRDALLAMNARDLKASRDDFAPTLARIKREKRLVFETMARRADGTLFPVEVSCRVMEIGGTEYIQGIVRNISERRQAEEHIRRLNRLYAVLSESGRAIVQSQTRDELFERVAGIAATQGQFPVSAIVTFSDDRRLPVIAARAGEAAAFLDAVPILTGDDGTLDPLLRDRPVVSNELRDDRHMSRWRDEVERFGIHSSILLPIRQGSYTVGVLALFSSEPAFFNDAEARLAGEVASSVYFALDALERKKQQAAAETSMRHSRDRLERVLDAINEGYWDWNLITGEMHLSPRYHTMLGYIPGELKPDWDFWLALAHPEDRIIAETAFNRFIEGRQDTFALEWRMRCKSSQYIWVLTRGKVEERDRQGVPTRLVGTHTDITDRKKLEDQFRQSQKLESVGRLAGGIAHDFNNLLTVINGFTEVVLSRLDIGDPNHRHLEAVQQAGERAAGLTEQLLAFSRKQAMTPRLLRLNSVMKDMERLLRRLLHENIDLVMNFAAKDDQVMIDPSQINQVVMNLVVNAKDAMPAGGRLTLATTVAEVASTDTPDLRPGPYVVLSVSDTGVGMDDETRSHIFEPFFTTKDQGKGTGLGLATVYGIVGQSGGFIKVESEPDGGSTFQIYLPQIQTGSAQPLASRVILDAQAGSETILIAEDQPLVRDLAVETLQRLGYVVLAAANGDEALHVSHHHNGPIDLLLTDVVMPGMDGGDLAEQIVSLRPETKIVFMSGYTDDVLAAHQAPNESAPYLAKPFTPTALAAKVREVLGTPVVAVAGVSLSRRSVLVVDDDESVRKLFPELLGTTYETLLAADGGEAIDLVKRGRNIDLVITDLFMPHHDGIETIQILRDLRPGTPIIAISGAFGGQFLKAAERFGVEATLQKPIHRELLLRTVADVLTRSLRPT
jgi:PAS domain S-box-containing protein